MCGVPYHALATYLPRLLEAGRRVAIADQTEDPAQARGLVRRDIVRIITPGTVTDPGLLERLGESLLAAVVVGPEGQWGLAVADASTGSVRVAALDGDDQQAKVLAELRCAAPREVLVERTAPPAFLEWLRTGGLTAVTVLGEGDFADQSGDGADASLDPAARRALRGITSYLGRTLRAEGRSPSVQVYRPSQFMGLDPVAQRNLELTVRIDGTKGGEGTLLGAVDRTVTPMGRRLLRFWLLHPLLDLQAIAERQAAVSELIAGPIFREGLRRGLRRVYDLERLTNRVVTERASPRELWALGASLAMLPEVKSALAGCGAALLQRLAGELVPMRELAERLGAALAEDAPAQTGQGGIFRPGFDPELDALHAAMTQGRAWIAELEQRERERTGIRNLKVGFNRVFGYYLEVSSSNLSLVPDDYRRKQTLSGGERYVTDALKELQDRILGAEEKALAREGLLFSELRQHAAAHAQALESIAAAIAELDVLGSLAETGSRSGWVMPTVDRTRQLVIRDGRHPVLDQLLGPGRFVPNDVDLRPPDRRLLLITGPNMAGKSTFMRQVSLITLLAQVGSPVPASVARIGLCDRIFTRIGASDDLAGGRSTFMVEMMEVASVLTAATDRSLVLLDEVGRGTGTLDGLAIAWAVLEDIDHRIAARTLFATHYHELTAAAAGLPGACNTHAVVAEEGDHVVFLHRIADGPSDRSYGIAVATLAGVPREVCQRARELLGQLEVGGGLAAGVAAAMDADPVAPATGPEKPEAAILRRLAGCDPLRLTPLQALDMLFTLQADAHRALADAPSPRIGPGLHG